MAKSDVEDWSVYAPGPDSAVVTSTTLALLDAAVPADVVSRVWDAARQGGGLAQVVAPLVGSLADLPTFAVVVIDDGRARALVRGDLEVVVGGTVVGGQGVTTWREETLTTAEGDPQLEITVRRADHATAAVGTAESAVPGLPVLAGVVRAAQVTGSLDLRASVAGQPGQGPTAGGAEGSDGAEGAEPGAGDADPDPVVPIPLPVPAGVELPGDGESVAVTAADEPGSDDAAPEEPESGEAEPESDEAEPDAPLQPEPEPEPDHAAPDEPLLDEPAVAPSLDGLELGHAADPTDTDPTDTGPTAADPADTDPTATDTEPDTEPLLDLDVPLDVTLRPVGDESASDLVSDNGSSIVPPRPGSAPASPVERSGDSAPAAPVITSTGEAAPSDHHAWSVPGPPAPRAEAGATDEDRSERAAPAPVAPVPADTAPDDVDGDHDGGTILDHQVAGLRDAGLVTVSPWSRPTAEPEPPRLHLSFSHGVQVALDRPVLVGRAPEARPGLDAQLVAVPSPQQDISRTHCEIRLDGEDVLVTDLRSTNGTVVARPGQVPHRLHPGEGTSASAGSRIDLGDGVVIVVGL